MSSDKKDEFLAAVKDRGFSKEEIQAIEEIRTIRHYAKGDVLVSEGQVSSMSYHVVKGCVRQYHIRDGEEVTTYFYTEDDAIPSSTQGKSATAPSDSFLECLEDCEIIATSPEQERAMYRRFPRFQEMCRVETERQLEEQKKMFTHFFHATPQERYLHLVESRADLLDRVPQYQLASYIGIKPESLSRIRRRLAKS